MATRFIFKRNGEEAGPLTLEQLKALLDSGGLSPGTPIRSEKMKRWWIPSDFGWFPLQLLSHPIHLRDIRIPRSTVIRWVLIVIGLLALVAVRIFTK